MANFARTIAATYLTIGLLLALAFHWIMYGQGSDPPPDFEWGYVGQLLSFVAFWPLFAIFIFITIAAAAGTP